MMRVGGANNQQKFTVKEGLLNLKKMGMQLDASRRHFFDMMKTKQYKMEQKNTLRL